MIRYSPFLLHQFVIEADRAHKAPGDGAAVSVHISFLTSHRPPSDQIIHGGGLPTTPIILAVPPAKLAALRGVAAVKSYFGASDLQRIAINHDCVPRYVGQGGGWQRKAQHQQEKARQWARPIAWGFWSSMSSMASRIIDQTS
jgi:hypothetical protein